VSAMLSRYAERVYAFCFRFAEDHDLARDLAQDALLQAYEKLDSLQDASRFRPWLFAIARNRCLMEFRKVNLLRDCTGELEDLQSPEPDPARRYEEEVDRAALERLILESLDAREQEAIYLRCFERMSVDSITAALGVGEASGARGLLQRARRKLRSAMAADGREEGSRA